MKQPIILIPGIQGTKLHNVNERNFNVMWSGIKKFFSNIHDLKLQKDGVSDLGAERLVERADVEDIAYSEIINFLRAKGYRVYIFGYDWRKSNAISAEKLGKLIKNLTNKLNTSSFNFITHSMGGLVLSAYIKSLSETEQNTIINKAILTVPPFLGSVEASFNLTIGKSRLFNTSDDFRKVGRTFPALYELLPVYRGAYGFESDKTANNFNKYDFSTFWQQVKDLDSRRVDTVKKHRLIAHRLEELGEIRNENDYIFDFGKCSPEFRSKLLVIAGSDSETKSKIYVKKEMGHIKNFFDYEHFENTDGDGTVPIHSATAFKDKLLTLKVGQKSLETWADSRFLMSDWHAFMLNNGRVQNIIKRFLSSGSGKLQDYRWYRSIGDKHTERVT
ncbi:MAG TPA: alpha/beta hydrolase [Lutibacter sp.]|nr:alpha/beta hydrolase [Lutibacter sp.]